MELKNSNEIRLKLLCKDILNDTINVKDIKRCAENYLRILEQENKEKERYERTLEKTI